MLLQGLNNPRQLARHDPVQGIEGVIDPVIGQAILGKIVGADFFGPHSPADGGAVTGNGFFFFCLLPFEKFGSKQT